MSFDRILELSTISIAMMCGVRARRTHIHRTEAVACVAASAIVLALGLFDSSGWSTVVTCGVLVTGGFTGGYIGSLL